MAATAADGAPRRNAAVRLGKTQRTASAVGFRRRPRLRRAFLGLAAVCTFRGSLKKASKFGMRGLAALLRRNTQLLLECSRLQPVLEEQQVHCCAAPASAGSPLDLPRRRTCKSSNDGVPGWRAQHVKGASDAATLQPPASSGGHVGSGMLDVRAAHERHRSRAPALDPVTLPAAFTPGARQHLPELQLALT